MWRGSRRAGGGGRERAREPAWEPRRSAERDERRERRHERDRDDRRERSDRDRERYRSRERYERSRSRSRSRRRSPRRTDSRSPPAPPSPPTISGAASRSSRSSSRERDEEAPAPQHASPGDWFCKCGSYNFKRRQICYRRNCQGKRAEGVVYGGDGEKGGGLESNSGITKRLLFRRLDALTTEEKILEAVKERCSKSVLDSIAGITIGREALTGASKCLAYINFNSIADSTAAHSELMSLDPPLAIDARDVLVSFYNEPQKTHKPPPPQPAEYSAYYGQVQSYRQARALSEADRVNAAAAVAQSAISAAAARLQAAAWAPAAPAFTAAPPAAPAGPARAPPSGDGATVYSAPDVRTFLYDESSGYYYDPATGLYYDAATQYFYNAHTAHYLYWDAAAGTYVAATQLQQNTEQPKLPSPPRATADNTIARDPDDKKRRDKEDKVKVAKKIAKDMERWARTLNQKKENARTNVVVEQPLDTAASKGSADIGFSVLGAAPPPAPHAALVRELSPPPADEFLLKRAPAGGAGGAEPLDGDEGIIDWAKLTCLVCKRRFPTAEVVSKHKTLSELHKQNLAEHRKRAELAPQPNGYRDRAAERRMKFGEEEPAARRRYSPPPAPAPPAPHSAPPPSVVDTIGGKMLQRMGWSMGRGLGKAEQGRTAPVEARGGGGGAGLGAAGARRGIYTPTPGETYRDTVKKLMIARYKEVVGQEDHDN